MAKRKSKSKAKASAKKRTIKRAMAKAVKKAVAKAKRRSIRFSKGFGPLPLLGTPVYKKHTGRFPKTRVAMKAYQMRSRAKSSAGGIRHSFRPRLYIQGGQVFASPLSDARPTGYAINPSRRNKMRHMSLFRGIHGSPFRTKKYHRNPSALKAILSKDNIMSTVGIAGGFIAGVKGGKFIYTKVPSAFRKFAGLITFGLGTVIALKVRNNILKKAGMGVAVSGLYDLITQNIPQLGLMPIAGIDLDMPHTPNFVGATFDLEGETQLVGGETFNVAGETVLVGGEEEMDGEGVYASL